MGGRLRRHVALGGALAATAIVGAAAPASAAAFTGGNVVVCRVGSGGSTTLVNTGAAVFLDEYTPAGTLVQTVALPTTASGANKPLIASGTATSECLVTRSADGRYLLVTGYGTTLGGTVSLSGTASATVPRVIARVDGNGVVDTTTALTDAATGNNPRSAASVDGSTLWIAGGAGGVRATTLGGTTSTQLATAPTNVRQLGIAAGQLFASSASGTNIGVNAVGVGLPTTAGQTVALVPGLTNASAYSYVFADLSASVPGNDTVYVADDTSTTGGILKYSLVGASWVANGVIGAGADAYRGLAGSATGTNVSLFATRKGGSAAAGGGELVSFTDTTGYNVPPSGTPTLRATAATNTALRGVALAPTADPTPVVPEAPMTALLTLGAVLGLAGGLWLTRSRRTVIG